MFTTYIKFKWVVSSNASSQISLTKFDSINFSSENLEKCGHEHYVKDLIDLIDNVVKGKKYRNRFLLFFRIYSKKKKILGKNHSKEVKKCFIPNCTTKTWKIIRHESWDGSTGFQTLFDSGRKVNYFIHTLTQGVWLLSEQIATIVSSKFK